MLFEVRRPRAGGGPVLISRCPPDIMAEGRLRRVSRDLRLSLLDSRVRGNDAGDGAVADVAALRLADIIHAVVFFFIWPKPSRIFWSVVRTIQRCGDKSFI